MSEILDYDYNWKSAGIRVGDDPSLDTIVESRPCGVILPLREGSERSGIFEMTFDPILQIRNNFKNLLQTNKNERLGNPLYGANLRPLCAEYSSIENFEAVAMENIRSSVLKFMPIIELDDFVVNFVKNNDPAMLRIDIKIKYNVPKLGAIGNIITVSFNVI